MKRLLLIGLDGAMLSFIKKFSEDGKLPCFRRLMEEGSFAEALPAMPTDTPTNWTTIATGAWTGTHGITGFSAHLPGEPLDKSYPTMGTKMCKAEFLWDVAEKADKTCILLYYPISWPPTIKKGIVIDGAGPAGMGEFRLSPETQFATKTSIETRNWYGSSPISVSPSKAKDWTNLPKSFSTPLEMVVSISSGVLISWTAEGPVIVGESESVTKGTYHAVVLDRSKKGYDRVLICREKDASKPVASLNVGEWSDWIFESFEEPKETVKGYFKFKLAELSSNAEKLILHRTEVFKGEGWAYPKQVSEELVKNVGPFIPSIECRARFDSATNFEQARYQADYLVKAAEYLTKNYQWDLFITQVHIQDWLNHRWLSYMCEKSSTYDPEKAKHAWSEQSYSYQIVDEMIAKLMRICVDENTITIVVSDHAACPTWKGVCLPNAFIKAGLLTVNETREPPKFAVDWSKTKVFPYDSGYIWVNLKGRDPDGTVEPGKEYERTRDAAISTLYAIRDPETDECPIAVALRKEDACSLGQWGERVADIICVPKPGYRILAKPMWEGNFDKIIFDWSAWSPWPKCVHHYMPNAKMGIFWNSAAFFMHGPGIKRGCEMKRPIDLVDVAPTISHLLGIPLPAQAEGTILSEMFQES